MAIYKDALEARTDERRSGGERMDELTKQIELMGRWLNNSKVAAIAAIMIFSALPVLAIGSAAYYSANRALTKQIIDDNLEQTRALRVSINPKARINHAARRSRTWS